MPGKLLNYMGLARAYLMFNIKTQLEYRVAFASQAVAMMFNNLMWLAYFVMFFEKFPVMRNWGAADTATLWAVTSAGFGLAHCLFGNSLQLARIITTGELDNWLLYPRNLLSHLMLGKMHASAFGDFTFGYLAYILIVRPDLPHLLLFAVLTVSVAILFLGFSIGTGSLSFFVGNGQALSESWRNALFSISLYPPDLFTGPTKLLLFTVLPAAYISGLPVAALRHLSLTEAACSLLGAMGVLGCGIAAFHLGLRRYESGNIIAMRG